jgi:hypothetical protein
VFAPGTPIWAKKGEVFRASLFITPRRVFGHEEKGRFFFPYSSNSGLLNPWPMLQVSRQDPGSVRSEQEWKATIEITLVLLRSKEERHFSPLGVWVTTVQWAEV